MIIKTVKHDIWNLSNFWNPIEWWDEMRREHIFHNFSNIFSNTKHVFTLFQVNHRTHIWTYKNISFNEMESYIDGVHYIFEKIYNWTSDWKTWYTFHMLLNIFLSIKFFLKNRNINRKIHHNLYVRLSNSFKTHTHR